MGRDRVDAESDPRAEPVRAYRHYYRAIRIDLYLYLILCYTYQAEGGGSDIRLNFVVKLKLLTVSLMLCDTSRGVEAASRGVRAGHGRCRGKRSVENRVQYNTVQALAIRSPLSSFTATVDREATNPEGLRAAQRQARVRRNGVTRPEGYTLTCAAAPRPRAPSDRHTPQALRRGGK